LKNLENKKLILKHRHDEISPAYLKTTTLFHLSVYSVELHWKNVELILMTLICEFAAMAFSF